MFQCTFLPTKCKLNPQRWCRKLKEHQWQTESPNLKLSFPPCKVAAPTLHVSSRGDAERHRVVSLAGTGLLEQPYLRGVCQAPHLHHPIPRHCVSNRSLGSCWEP